MTGASELFDAYVTEHRGGGAADPVAYLQRADPGDRAELAALIDGYLDRAPRRPMDPGAFAGSPEEATVDALQRSLDGVAGLWPTVLPALRHRAGLRRSELVRRLAEVLGVGDREQRVGDYYHEMEQGLLPSAGVSERVLTALGTIVGETAEALRETGRALTPPARPSSAPDAFARRATADGDGDGEPVAGPAAGAPPPTGPEPPDEVDRLFRGG